MKKINPVALQSKYNLDYLGLKPKKTVYWNLTSEELYEEAISRKEGNITRAGAFTVETGKHTGRSPNDRYFVETDDIKDTLWWHAGNKGVSQAHFENLFKKALQYAQERDLFVRDAYIGASSTMAVRLIGEYAWHNLFAKNMFIEPPLSEVQNIKPEFTSIYLPGLKADPATDGTVSETAIMTNFKKKIILIVGTAYAGESKKTVFTVMNYLLPLKGIMTMHCSANVGPKGDSALFFGLSGTGKTTLSADPRRGLIGDDEHGWDNDGVFNFEGGCYAKVIKLSKEAEPEIYSTTGRFGTVLENVVFDETTRALDLDSVALTENTRACYPLEFISNCIESKKGGHPKNIIFLTYDAFGVLPPIAKLSKEQAMYHFISGYTAKVAGTEKGVKEPQTTFSACFGGPFMALHPSKYAEILKKKIEEHKASCWLVNTGLVGGPYGVGSRISIKHTRALLNAALEGKLNNVQFVKDEVFGFEIPAECEGVDSSILQPANTWKNKNEYYKKYNELAAAFIKNFEKFKDGSSQDILKGAPKAK
jgi:phosphoenolpyruvate carboxykinase (ATP)